MLRGLRQDVRQPGRFINPDKVAGGSVFGRAPRCIGLALGKRLIESRSLSTPKHLHRTTGGSNRRTALRIPSAIAPTARPRAIRQQSSRSLDVAGFAQTATYAGIVKSAVTNTATVSREISVVVAAAKRAMPSEANRSTVGSGGSLEGLKPLHSAVTPSLMMG